MSVVAVLHVDIRTREALACVNDGLASPGFGDDHEPDNYTTRGTLQPDLQANLAAG